MMIISVIRTVILYAFIIFAIRLMGKRQIGDMQPSELVVTMVISDIASLPMQNTSQPLLSGVIPVLVLVALEVAVSVCMMKSRGLRRMICGSPVVIIEDGKLLQNQMKRLRLTVDDLFAQLRQQDVFSLDDVQYCVMETNGTLSILEKPQKRVPNAEELGVSIPDDEPETIVIADGRIIEPSSAAEKTDRAKIDKILQKNNIMPCEVFLMTVNKSGQARIIKKSASRRP